MTTIRDTGDATEAAVAFRGLLQSGEIRGPRMLTAGRILNTGSFHHAIDVPVNTAEEVRRGYCNRFYADLQAQREWSSPVLKTEVFETGTHGSIWVSI